jgi:hypothetical protein
VITREAQPVGGWWRKQALPASIHVACPHPGINDRYGGDREPCSDHFAAPFTPPYWRGYHAFRQGQTFRILFGSHFRRESESRYSAHAFRCLLHYLPLPVCSWAAACW